MEHFGGGDIERKDTTYPEPELQIVPAEVPPEKKFPEGIEHWPDISILDEDAPLPGESDEKRPPTIH